MTHSLEIEALLAESDWLRALAGSLLRPGAEAEDLVQETWLAALRRPPRTEGEPRPWLARVARNLARNTRRERSRRAAREAFAHEEPTPPGPATLAQAAEAQRLLAEAVTRLAPELRDVVVLRYFHGLDSRAAGARLGVPGSTVRNRIARALEALRADLDRRRGGREAWAAVLAPLVGRMAASGSFASAASPSLALGSSVVLVLAAVGVCALVAAGAFEWRAGRKVAELEPPPEPTVFAGAPVASSDYAASATREAQVPSTDAASNEPEASLEQAAAPVPFADELVELAGTILVDGREPEYTLELTLEPVLRSQSGDRRPRPNMQRETASLRPEERGRFSFWVPGDWRGELGVQDYFLVSGEVALPIDAPRTGIQVRLSSGPEIVGRILSDDHHPLHLVGQALIREERDGAMVYEEGFPLRTQEDGRFRLPNPVGEGRGYVNLRVESEVHGFLLHERTDFEPAEDLDLGDLVVVPPRTVAFRVTNSRGEPLSGARAWVEPMGDARASEPSDPDGLGSLGFAPQGEAELRFSALGYADRVVEVPPAGTVEVVLEPLTTLEVQVVGSLAVEMNELRLTSPVAVYLGDLSGMAWDAIPAAYQAQLGAAVPYGFRSLEEKSGDWWYAFHLSSDGRCPLTGLAPNAPITIEVLGPDRRVLESRTVSLADGEHATLTLGDPSTGSEPAPGKAPPGTGGG
jgi:RNA polymerase sigma-70 factor (ECF subfamily)